MVTAEHTDIEARKAR